MIIERFGEDNVRLIAKPRFVDTAQSEFQETLEKFVVNNWKTEQRRHGKRSIDEIRTHCIRGIVAEFALKQINSVEDNCPLVDDIKKLDYYENKTDQLFKGFRIQTKSKKIGGPFWSMTESQYYSINSSMAYNDYFVVVGVKKEFDGIWLAVPELLIEAHRIMRCIRKSQYGSGYYYDIAAGKENIDHLVLTNYLKPDRIKELEECT